MGNWIPNDPTLVTQILKISSAYSPPPPEGFVSPMTWGIEKNVIERFEAAGVPRDRISFARETYTFNFPGAPREFVDTFRRYYGPTMNAFEAAEKDGRASDLQRSWKPCSKAKTGVRTRASRPFRRLSCASPSRAPDRALFAGICCLNRGPVSRSLAGCLPRARDRLGLAMPGKRVQFDDDSGGGFTSPWRDRR